MKRRQEVDSLTIAGHKVRAARHAASVLVPLFVCGAVACSNRASEPAPPPAADPAPVAGKTAAPPADPAKPAAKPYFFSAGTAPAVWGPGDLYNMLATGEQTNGELFQFEARVPKGGGPPPHIHANEDETFYIVKGTLDVLVGDTVHTAKAGDFVFIPRGTVHRFVNVGDEPAVQFVTFTPAGMEGFFKEAFPVATDRNAAPPPVTDALIKKMNEVAPKYGVTFVPMPDSAKK
jgi:quercetin dioxygenase-like cupin family protein